MRNSLLLSCALIAVTAQASTHSSSQNNAITSSLQQIAIGVAVSAQFFHSSQADLNAASFDADNEAALDDDAELNSADAALNDGNKENEFNQRIKHQQQQQQQQRDQHHQLIDRAGLALASARAIRHSQSFSSLLSSGSADSFSSATPSSSDQTTSHHSDASSSLSSAGTPHHVHHKQEPHHQPVQQQLAIASLPSNVRQSPATPQHALSFLFPSGTETGAQRRALLDAWDHKAALHTVFGDLPLFDETQAKHTVSHFVNARKQKIYTHSYTPLGVEPPVASILMLHGYNDHSAWLNLVVVDFFVITLGCRVFLMDHAGHGRSDGLHIFIPRFESLVEDALQYSYMIRRQMTREQLVPAANDQGSSRPAKQKLFLYSESMGGALAFHCGTQHPELYAGAIFSAPMCKIADSLKPHPVVISMLKVFARVAPTWACTPVSSMPGRNYRRQDVHDLARESPLALGRQPRLGTAVQLLHVTTDIGPRLHEWKLPLLVLHGAADEITDPQSSRAFYKASESQDKHLHIYKDAMHQLMLGEPPELTRKIRHDIAQWLHEHLKPNPRLTHHRRRSYS